MGIVSFQGDGDVWGRFRCGTVETPLYNSSYGQLRRATNCEYVWEMRQEVEAMSLHSSTTIPSTVYAVQLLRFSDI